jgi:hypothetical protein
VRPESGADPRNRAQAVRIAAASTAKALGDPLTYLAADPESVISLATLALSRELLSLGAPDAGGTR